MKKLKASEQTDYAKMYVYSNQFFEDLVSMVAEYCLEAEHDGIRASMHELSSDTVDDMKEWCKKRKDLLFQDFFLYFT